MYPIYQSLWIELCFCFVSLRLVYPMLPVSLDCVVFLFCFSPSCLPYVGSFSGLWSGFALFLSVFSTLCCQFLWIVLCFCFVSLRLLYPMLPVSLDCVVFLFYFSPSCLSYVTSFSGLCFVFVLFFSVLSTLCYQFLWIVECFSLFLSVFSTLCCQFLQIVLCFCFVPLRLVYPMLQVSLDCVVFLFCFSPSCLPYATSFSRLCCVFALFLSVLSTLCY